MRGPLPNPQTIKARIDGVQFKFPIARISLSNDAGAISSTDLCPHELARHGRDISSY